jgi:hypothetical protein
MSSLHDRQQAILDTLARIDGPVTLRELHAELPHVGMAALLRALDVLEHRGLTHSTGSRAWAFIDGPVWDGPVCGPDEIARFSLAA